MPEPKHNRGKSVQAVRTPPEFLAAVKDLLGIKGFDIDLAASSENKVCERYYSEHSDALVRPWRVGRGWNWCNPPFGQLEPWVQKAFEELCIGAGTAMLVPAGVGANWWKNWVHHKARVMFLNGRLTFVGHDNPYPKDLALLLYGPPFPLYHVWNWKLGKKGVF